MPIKQATRRLKKIKIGLNKPQKESEKNLQHLSWKPHIFETANKLRRANGALSKFRHYIPLKTLVGIYHAIFSSHMLAKFGVSVTM